MTDLDAELEARFGTAVVSETLELHPSLDTPSPKPAVRGKARKVARGQVWSPVDNVCGVLGTGKAYSAEEICRLTGLMPEQCSAGLAALGGEVRRVEGKWEMVL